MRLHEFTSINEARTTGRYLMHMTPGKNLAAILKMGLVPNHNGGSYSDSEWVSLEGVYATDEINVLTSYMQAHDISDDFGLLVLWVQQGGSLPDEDIIVDTLGHAYAKVVKETGCDPVDGEFDEDEQKAIEPGGSFWHTVAEHFTAMVGPGLPPDDVLELVDWWADFKMGLGNVEPLAWAAMKDRMVRVYRNIQSQTYGRQHSVRIEGVVGFEGKARIVTAYRVTDGYPELVFGKLPSTAARMVAPLVSDPATSNVSSANMRQEITRLATIHHPDKTPDEIKDRVASLRASHLPDMLERYRSKPLPTMA